MAILESSRLTLRPFCEDDVDRMAELFANRDFMRFSLGGFHQVRRDARLHRKKS